MRPCESVGGARCAVLAQTERPAWVCFPFLLLAHLSPPFQVELGKPCIPPKRLSPGDFTTVLAEFQMFRVVRGRSGHRWCRSWGWTGPGARMGLQGAGAQARLGLWSRQGAGDLIGRNLWV